MANYTIEDIQNALQQNLISEEDAQYLAQELEPGAPVGGMAGGALGAAGLGMLGGALGGGAGQRLGKAAGEGMMGKMARGAGEFMQKEAPGIGAGPGAAGMNMGGAMGAGAGAALGGGAGAMSGDMMMPPAEGQGVQGEMGPGGPDRDMLMQALMDPNTPPREKKQIMQMLQEMDAQMPPGEAGVGADSGMMGGALGAGLGGLMGGAAGSKLGGKMGPKIAGMMGGKAPMAAGAGLGGLMGGGAGMMMDADPGPYAKDPKQKLAAYAEPF